MNFLWENIFKRAQEEKNISIILGHNLLFQDLTKRELRFVENIVHIRHYRSGENVFRQGEIGIGMYIIVKGTVDIYVSDNLEDIEPNKDMHITRLTAGDFFGELSLVEDNGPRSASAKAHEDSMLIGFFKPDLLEILDRSPTAGVKILFRLAAVLGQRLKETTDKISHLRKELRLIRHQRVQRSSGERIDHDPGSKPSAT